MWLFFLSYCYFSFTWVAVAALFAAVLLVVHYCSQLFCVLSVTEGGLLFINSNFLQLLNIFGELL